MLPSLTLKRIALSLATVFVVFLLGSELLTTLQESQIQDRLELYQTRLVLQANEFQLSSDEPEAQRLEANLQQLRSEVLGADPIGTALEDYRALITASESPTQETSADPLQWSPREIDRLRLEAGLLEVVHRQSLEPPAQRLRSAEQHWQGIRGTDREAAAILQALWQDPPSILPDAQEVLTTSLEGWFSYRALERLYTVQQRPEALAKLHRKENTTTQTVLKKLLILTGFPVLGMLLGSGLLITFIIRSLLHWSRGRSPSVVGDRSSVASQTLASQKPPQEPLWEVPWTGETTWIGVVVGFFLVGQIAVVRVLVPIVASLLQVLVGSAIFQTVKVQALLVVGVYGVMALSVLIFFDRLLESFRPLPPGWFQVRLDWKAVAWGIAGYLVALPLVTLVSLINQNLWQGQGGSNPMLFLALRNQDWFALGCFFFTASILAPLFEEWVFRGFLLASLTRHLPVLGAVLGSGLIFALAHLSASEILPLWMLGSILGYVYSRSQNLLSSIVLHSLWNAGTLIGLTILGSTQV